MVHAVASTRVALKPRISKAIAKATSRSKEFMENLAIKADAPLGVSQIPNGSTDVTSKAKEDLAVEATNSSVVIRQMGTSRRVFLLSPYLSGEEIEGLAFRLKSLSKSESINSVLIATDSHDDLSTNCLPRYLTKISDGYADSIHVDFEPKLNHTWHVCGGYNPLEISGDNIQYYTKSLKELALAVKGDNNRTRVPIITLPHGAITDGGYAICMGGYVLATKSTSFQIVNPSRGLSFDPIGLSYVLPRVGRDYNQYVSKRKASETCGMIMGLTGYEADYYDMVETGLATHIVENSPDDVLAPLEHALATIPAWEQQQLVKKPKHYYGQRRPNDANARFRNLTLAQIIEESTDYSACYKENSLPIDYTIGHNSEDPALDTDIVPWDDAFVTTELVDMSIAFDSIFKQERNLEGIMERLREVAARDIGSDDEDGQAVKDWANDLVTKMEYQSPLALRVTHQLLKMGTSMHATFESCMELEAKAITKMIGKPDYQEWVNHIRKHSDSDAGDIPKFRGWQHSSVADVTAEEVDEILS